PYPGNDVRTDLIQLSIAAAALLLTLFVVAVGLALSAAESRDERDVLTAVGAKPSTLRRVAAEKAVLMSLTGTLLALPAGLLLIVAVLRAIDDGNPGPTPIDVSWLTLGLLVLGVPLLAGVVTWIGSSIAQRLRPVHMSTLHAD
ncbi:MAG: FtsX-like permease family protein, partial [Ilumatobacteraceae bacterium]